MEDVRYTWVGIRWTKDFGAMFRYKTDTQTDKRQTVTTGWQSVNVLNGACGRGLKDRQIDGYGFMVRRLVYDGRQIVENL